MKQQTLILPNGFRVAVTTAGQPYWPALVLLHGLTVSAGAYAELIEELVEHGYYVIAPDAPNHGGSGSLPCGHTVGDMADILALMFSELDTVHALVVGHSMGGGLAVEFAARYPELVDGVVLLDAAAGAEFHESIRVGPKHTLALRAAQKLAGAFVDVVGDGITAMRSRSLRGKLSLLSTLKDSVDGFRFVQVAKALMDFDSAPALEKLKANRVPTAVIHGEHDQIIPVEAGISAALAAGGSFFLVENAFHSWMLADPEFAADLIEVAVAGFR
ncbi:esterase/lipase [Mycobacterium phage Kimona]|uniref:Esterase/lipase n=1 Tax=Mycobacterium phage Kimona TaxID=2024295 RepID=A0A249XU20_9CAUD|nr:esterase/lipase [Mycobacterium phage Kimona]ASZ75493.1 esterase/lipase [Mycobacterium phage Kimona]